jgi:DNA-binding NarL/FixJ family response regulator
LSILFARELAKKIIIADTQALTSAGLAKILSELKPLHVIDLVASADQLFAAIDKDDSPDFLFIDYLFLPDFGVESFDNLLSGFTSMKVIVLSSDNDQETILRVIDSGVPGFLTKECSEEEIKTAIRAIEKGEKFFCHRIFDIVIRSRSKQDKNKPSFLSERELEIIKMIALGNSTMQIAFTLNLSHHTISSHRKNIIKKLNIKSPTEFVVHAMDLGLISFNADHHT